MNVGGLPDDERGLIAARVADGNDAAGSNHRHSSVSELQGRNPKAAAMESQMAVGVKVRERPRGRDDAVESQL